MFENPKVNCKNQQGRGTESIIAAISAIDLIKAVFKEPYWGSYIGQGEGGEWIQGPGHSPPALHTSSGKGLGGGEEMIELA